MAKYSPDHDAPLTTVTIIGEPYRLQREGQSQPRTYVKCVCSCGKEFATELYSVRSGNTKSCGCLKVLFGKSKATHSERRTKLYGVWSAMKARCTNPNVERYANYGGRGIRVCREWMESYAAFSTWARENGYAEGLQLDRKDNDGHYEPDNCRWSTGKMQARNKSDTVMITAFGETKSLPDWIEDGRCNALPHAVNRRIKKGWIPEDAISTPAWDVRPEAERLREAMAESSNRFSEAELLAELWLPVPDFDAYEVSDLGRVRSYWVFVGYPRSKTNPRKAVIGDTPKLLKPSGGQRVSPHVTLYGMDRVPVQVLVPRLVLMTHVGPPPDGMQACHSPDPNPHNCRLKNLRWDTQSENNRDKTRLNRLLLKMIGE